MRALLVFSCLLLSTAINAQSVQQSGNVTPGHAACWAITGVVYDCGTPGGSSIVGSYTANDLVAVNGSGSLIDSGLSAVGANNWVGLQNFNGGATAPTRTFGDSTNNVATTAFVQAAAGTLPITGTPLDGYIPIARSSTTAQWTYALPFSVTTYGADPTGVADSTAAFQAALTAAETNPPVSAGYNAVFIPCGFYKVTPGSLTISVSNIAVVGENRHCVQLFRSADTGAMFTWALASGTLGGPALINVTITDVSAGTGAAGYATCANSPYQVIMDGVLDLIIEHVRFVGGCGGLALKGAITGNIFDLSMAFNVIPGVPSQSNLGTGMYIGQSANTNLGTRYSGGIWFDQTDIESGGITANTAKAAYGIWIDGCDGCWSSNGHVQGSGTANMRLSHSGSFPMANIQLKNWLWDITPAIGMLFDGTQAVTYSQFSGRVSSAGAFPANNVNGIQVTGTGCLQNVSFDVTIDGFGGGGYVSTASNCTNVVIHPISITNNNLSSGTNYGISVDNAFGLEITGGAIGLDNKLTSCIALGAGVQHVTVSGVVASGCLQYGITVASGATRVILMGNDLNDNGTATILDNAGAGLTYITSSTSSLILNAGTGGLLAFDVNGTSTLFITSSALQPGSNNTYTDGTSGSRWANVFSVLGNFSGAVTASTTLNVGTTLTVGGQLITTFGAPTIASGACGTGSNGSVSGTNQAGIVTIGASATTTCTISFSTTITAPNACVIFPGNATAAAQGTTLARVGTPGTTNWVITGSVLASTVYSYICI